MSTKGQSVTLLRKNKQAQVAAFNAVGMTDVTENSRASEFAKRIKWAGGLLDICLAVKRYSDNSNWYFTKEEWDSLTNENKEKFIKRGLRIRAYSHSFVLASSDCTDPVGNAAMAWGEKKAVEDLNNRVCGASYNDFAGAENTHILKEWDGGNRRNLASRESCLENLLRRRKEEEADGIFALYGTVGNINRIFSFSRAKHTAAFTVKEYFSLAVYSVYRKIEESGGCRRLIQNNLSGQFHPALAYRREVLILAVIRRVD